MDTFLEGKTALITGSSQGIGKALAMGFSKLGANVIITARNQEKLEETLKELEAKGGIGIIIPGDVQKYEDIQKIISFGKEKFGHIDILINNAGFSRLKPITKMRVEQFQDILKTNVIGVYNFTHAIVPHMIEIGGGTIVNTGSLVINSPGPKWSAYSMSKSSLLGFTECLGMELKNNQININTIMPGPVNTPLFRMGMTDEMIKAIGPMDPDNLIPYYAFFATQAGKKVTGLNIDVDLCKSIIKLSKNLGSDQELSWSGLKEIVKEKLKPESFKKAKKYRKLINFLLQYN
ncbi:MAG: SDR family NAD(P)-dependent oxidoreductase [Promethearchaeota archaeon]